MYVNIEFDFLLNTIVIFIVSGYYDFVRCAQDGNADAVESFLAVPGLDINWRKARCVAADGVGRGRERLRAPGRCARFVSPSAAGCEGAEAARGGDPPLADVAALLDALSASLVSSNSRLSASLRSRPSASFSYCLF